jgi:hypothetical protein
MESKNYEIWQGLFREIVEAPQILFATFWVHLNVNSNRANAHVRAFFFDLNLIQIFSSAGQMHAMMMTKHFIYLTSTGCYNSTPLTRISSRDS